MRLFTYLLLLALGLSLYHCEPAPRVDTTPTDCGYDSPRLSFSVADDCRPQLVRFTGLDNTVESSD